MNGRQIVVFLLALGVSAALVACGDENLGPQATDYSVAANWLHLPAAVNKPADVFYLYPTFWSNSNPAPQVCEIDEPSIE